MILDGRGVIDKKFVTFNEEAFVDTESQIQPNGVDLRLNRLYEVHGRVRVPTNGKIDHNLQVRQLEAKDNWFSIKPAQGTLYYVDFLEKISVPGGWCATLITRSSLIRSGVDVMSGLWDSGFTGNLGCTLRIHTHIDLEWGSKLCQVMFHDAKFNGHLYSGKYQGTNSQTAVTQ